MVRISLMAVAGLMVMASAVAAPAQAKECKADPVIAESRPYVSRSFGAFPASLVSWKKEAKSQYGDGWDLWRRSEDKDIRCEQVSLPGKSFKRWVCTRTARPCSGALGAEEVSYEYPGRLERGDKGDGVETLQKLLREAGFDIEVDGNFGRGTRSAVRDFQKAEGIKVDGIVGRETWERLVS